MTDVMALGGQAQRMRAALSPVLEIGPDFLAGSLAADEMAHTMVRVVQEFARGEQERQQDGTMTQPPTPESMSRTTQELQAVLAELYTCGSGYLADRCDSDCVVRTMDHIMAEYGEARA